MLARAAVALVVVLLAPAAHAAPRGGAAGGAKARPAAAKPAARPPAPRLELLVLFAKAGLGPNDLGLPAALRALHPSLKKASFDLDKDTPAGGRPSGIARFGEHAVRVTIVNAGVGADILERCVTYAHIPQSEKALARGHRSYVRLETEGGTGEALDRYAALAVVATALVAGTGTTVVNPRARTSVHAQLMEGIAGIAKDDILTAFKEVALPILFSGFVKYNLPDGTVFMRTHANALLGIPDLAFLAASHEQGEDTLFLFDHIMKYLLEYKAPLHAGHTMELNDDDGKKRYLRFRAPRRDEADVLARDGGDVLVVEIITRAESNLR